MNTVKEINRINERELELGLANKGSWHDAYKDSAYVFIGGLNYEMTEGDVITVFSQWGEIIDINMPRDQETHKPKGFAFVMYEDQRSTILAVDNMNGAQVLGRTVRVDHCKKYSQPGTRNAEGEYQEPEAPSYNAMPPVLSDSEDDGADDSDSEGSKKGEDEDEDDPMAKFLRAERKREKEERRLLAGGSGKKRKRDEAEKAEKRKRKEERARIRAERDRKKRDKQRGGPRDVSEDRYLSKREDNRSDSRSRSDVVRRREGSTTPPRYRRADRHRSRSPDNGPVVPRGTRDMSPDMSNARRRDSRSPDDRAYTARDGRANRDDWRQGRWELERERDRDRERGSDDDRAPRRSGPNDPSPDRRRDARLHQSRNGDDLHRDDRRNGHGSNRYREDDRPRNGDRRY